MKKLLLLLICLLLMAGTAQAAEVPQDLVRALPEDAAPLLRGQDLSGSGAFSDGVSALLDSLRGRMGAVLRQRIRGAVSVLLVVILCGAVDGLGKAAGEQESMFLSMAGALSITLLTAGSLDTLLGLGRETIEQLSLFSRALLPTLAAATAAAGSIGTATVQQVTAVFLVDLLVTMIHQLLLPLVYLYIGVLTASAALPDGRLGALAEGLKKTITWMLTTSLLLFTIYLSVSRVFTGAADAAAIKVTKAAISGVVPVVGGIISDAAETVLAGAGLLKNTIGVFGTLAILAACAYPFLQLGIQYLLYKLTAFLAAALGAPRLCRLVDGLGGAFGLVLGMTGSCALLILISVLSSVAAVVP